MEVEKVSNIISFFCNEAFETHPYNIIKPVSCYSVLQELRFEKLVQPINNRNIRDK